MNTPHPFRELPVLFLAGCWCVALSVFVFFHLGVQDCRFMPKNLVLACVPFAFSFWLRWVSSPAVGIALLLPWLVFFPNAPYLLTDLIHLRKPSGQHWYGVLLLTSFALVGLMLTFSSLRHVHEWVAARIGRRLGWCFVAATLFMSGFGIYLGRFLRWNSWDIITNPGLLMRDVADRLAAPFSHGRTWAVTLGFGVLLSLLYAHYRLGSGHGAAAREDARETGGRPSQ